MDDAELVRRISELTDEEHRLETSHIGVGLTDEEHQRLGSIEVALDQCWDLLRRRRARRSAGLEPEDEQVRDAEVVEHYQQ